MLRHSHDEFYQAPLFFSFNVEKLGGAWVHERLATPSTGGTVSSLCYTTGSLIRLARNTGHLGKEELCALRSKWVLIRVHSCKSCEVSTKESLESN